MKRVTRKGMFETNSSSTHSIVLSYENKFTPDKLPITNGEIHIYPGEFGWGPDEFTDAATKASYALTHVKDIECADSLEMLRKVIEEETGLTAFFYPLGREEYYQWGYIDHQSRGVGSEAFESERALRNFIFNPESILVIDNDNR
jgi:hypothetical protein